MISSLPIVRVAILAKSHGKSGGPRPGPTPVFAKCVRQFELYATILAPGSCMSFAETIFWAVAEGYDWTIRGIVQTFDNIVIVKHGRQADSLAAQQDHRDHRDKQSRIRYRVNASSFEASL